MVARGSMAAVNIIIIKSAGFFQYFLRRSRKNTAAAAPAARMQSPAVEKGFWNNTFPFRVKLKKSRYIFAAVPGRERPPAPPATMPSIPW